MTTSSSINHHQHGTTLCMLRFTFFLFLSPRPGFSLFSFVVYIPQSQSFIHPPPKRCQNNHSSPHSVTSTFKRFTSVFSTLRTVSIEAGSSTCCVFDIKGQRGKPGVDGTCVRPMGGKAGRRGRWDKKAAASDQHQGEGPRSRGSA